MPIRRVEYLRALHSLRNRYNKSHCSNQNINIFSFFDWIALHNYRGVTRSGMSRKPTLVPLRVIGTLTDTDRTLFSFGQCWCHMINLGTSLVRLTRHSEVPIQTIHPKYQITVDSHSHLAAKYARSRHVVQIRWFYCCSAIGGVN